MADIAATKATIRSALATISGLTPRARNPKTAKAGDVWVVVSRVEPSTDSLTACSATFIAVVLLSADAAQADSKADTLSVALVNTVTKHDTLRASDVAVEPIEIQVGEANPAPFYALTLTMTLEVD